jgi:hypothetical protein
MSKRLFSSLLLASGLAALGCSNGPIVVPAIATDQQGATALVANGAYLYWGMPNGTIRRAAIDGGSKVETVAEGIKTPVQLAVDDNNVYFAAIDGDIGSVPKTGGTPTILVSLEDSTVGLQTDGVHVYWARATGEVKKVATTGGKPDEIVADMTGPTSFGRQGPTLYFTTGDANDGAVKAAAGDAMKSSEATVADGVLSPENLSVTTSLAFWTGLDPDALAMDPTSNLRQVSRGDLEGNTIQQVGTGFQNVAALVADEKNVYLASDDLDTATIDPKTKQQVIHNTTIVSFANSGAMPSVIVRGPQSRVHVALDDTSIYWVFESDGAIGAASKDVESSTPAPM